AAPLPPVQTWPDIPGIATDDVRMRLMGDAMLFRSLLKHLFEEFSDVSVPGSDLHTLDGHARRMHKLKGAAGTLGASAIRTLAAEAEVASRDGRAERAAEVAALLSTELARLRANAEDFIAAPDRAIAPDAQGEIDPQALRSFIEQLRQHDLSAMDRFEL